MLKPRFEVEKVDKDNAHYYRDVNEDKFYVGATTILNVLSKPHLIPWAAKTAAQRIEDYLIANAVGRPLIPSEICELVQEGKEEHNVQKEKAAELGTRVHDAIDEIIRGNKPKLKEDEKSGVNAFLDWQKKTDLKIVLPDTKVLSKQYKYGGSLDALGKDKQGRYVVVDFKTSNYFSEEYAYQVSAYHQALKETYGIECERAIILKVHKTKGDFKVKEISSLKKAFSIFKDCVNLHYKRKEKLLVDGE